MLYGLAPRGGPVQITPLLIARGAGNAELCCIPGVVGCSTRKGSSPGVAPMLGPATKALLVITGLRSLEHAGNAKSKQHLAGWFSFD